MMTRGADWQAQLTQADRRRERLGWLGAAGAVAAALAATTVLALQSDAGRRDAEAILINLEPPAAAPPAEAVAEAAPDVPLTEAPEAPELVQDTQPPPEPMAEETPLPPPEMPEDLPEPQPDEVALPDAPPPPPPAIRPPPRPERIVREQPKPEPRREAAAPPPSQARQAAPSAQPGPSRQAMSAGQRQDLKRQWGNAIRARVERRIRGGRESGTVYVILTVTPSGQLTSLSLNRSSGSADLDRRVLQAVQSAAGSFPAAPAGLTAAEVFTIPLIVQ